jgi:hypothetical protein
VVVYNQKQPENYSTKQHRRPLPALTSPWKRGRYWEAEQLLVSHKGLCSMEFVLSKYLKCDIFWNHVTRCMALLSIWILRFLHDNKPTQFCLLVPNGQGKRNQSDLCEVTSKHIRCTVLVLMGKNVLFIIRWKESCCTAPKSKTGE